MSEQEAWEVDGNYEEQVELSSLENIKSDGITIRVGGQIIKFVADEVQDIGVEEEVRKELQEQYEQEHQNLVRQFDEFKNMVQDQVNRKNREIRDREKELEKRIRENVSLPVLNEDLARQGLTVSARTSGRGYLWSLVCVYAPKYINNKIIDPNFAKRLMTPIRIFVYTDSNWRVSEVKLVKLINCEKFQHYHSMDSGSDCWGGMKFSGEVLDTADKALKFIRDVQIVLETINGASIGNRAPRGLSRLATVEKHLLNERPDPENNKRSTTASRRNERAGFDESVNEEVTGELWDATS
jgi:hypothetical protein